MRKLIAVIILFLTPTVLLTPALELNSLLTHPVAGPYDDRHSRSDSNELHGGAFDAEGWTAGEHACPRAIPGMMGPLQEDKSTKNGIVTSVKHHLVDRALSTVASINTQLEGVLGLSAVSQRRQPGG